MTKNPSGKWHVRIPTQKYDADDIILHALDLELKNGITTALLGTSGVGKTTLLRTICGLSTEKCQGLSDNVRVSYMAQQDLLLPWLNISNNICLGHLVRGEKADKQKVEYLLNNVGLHTKYATYYPHQLSSGMRQRVALLRTLMENADIILLDEPFASLDAVTRSSVQDFACQIFQDKAVLLVTHDPLEAMKMASEIYVLSGRPANLSEKIDYSQKEQQKGSDYFNADVYSRLMDLLKHKNEESRP